MTFYINMTCIFGLNENNDISIYGNYSSNNSFKINPNDTNTMDNPMKIFVSEQNIEFIRDSLERSLQKIYGIDKSNKFTVSKEMVLREIYKIINFANFRYLRLKDKNIYVFRYIMKQYQNRLQTYAEQPRYDSTFLDSHSRATQSISRKRTRPFMRLTV